jgi:hypothetical protein
VAPYVIEMTNHTRRSRDADIPRLAVPARELL